MILLKRISSNLCSLGTSSDRGEKKNEQQSPENKKIHYREKDEGKGRPWRIPFQKKMYTIDLGFFSAKEAIGGIH